MKKKEKTKKSALEQIALHEARMDFKDTVVNMYGVDGNAYHILAAVQSALRRAGASKEINDLFFEEATAGDYENLLKVCDDWVTIVNVAPRNSHASAVAAFDTIGKKLED